MPYSVGMGQEKSKAGLEGAEAAGCGCGKGGAVCSECGTGVGEKRIPKAGHWTHWRRLVPMGLFGSAVVACLLLIGAGFNRQSSDEFMPISSWQGIDVRVTIEELLQMANGSVDSQLETTNLVKAIDELLSDAGEVIHPSTRLSLDIVFRYERDDESDFESYSTFDLNTGWPAEVISYSRIRPPSEASAIRSSTRSIDLDSLPPVLYVNWDSERIVYLNLGSAAFVIVVTACALWLTKKALSRLRGRRWFVLRVERATWPIQWLVVFVLASVLILLPQSVVSSSFPASSSGRVSSSGFALGEIQNWRATGEDEEEISQRIAVALIAGLSETSDDLIDVHLTLDQNTAKMGKRIAIDQVNTLDSSSLPTYTLWEWNEAVISGYESRRHYADVAFPGLRVGFDPTWPRLNWRWLGQTWEEPAYWGFVDVGVPSLGVVLLWASWRVPTVVFNVMFQFIGSRRVRRGQCVVCGYPVESGTLCLERGEGGE